jgi:hypothetical protein
VGPAGTDNTASDEVGKVFGWLGRQSASCKRARSVHILGFVIASPGLIRALLALCLAKARALDWDFATYVSGHETNDSDAPCEKSFRRSIGMVCGAQLGRLDRYVFRATKSKQPHIWDVLSLLGEWQNRSTAPATALATVALRAGDESTCSSARLTIMPASRSTAGIRDSYSTTRLS